MATSALVTPTSALSSHRDRHDAASALLSCLSASVTPHLSPPSPHPLVAINTITTPTNDKPHETPPTPISSSLNNDETHCLSTLLQLKSSHPPPPPRTRIGLDALADLASAAVSSSSPSPPPHDDDDDSPPRGHRRRMRSVSNPEGMEKWDALGRQAQIMRHFSSVKEEDEEVTAATNNSTASSSSFVLDCEELEPDELLRRARSRLLEDVNQYCNVSGEKGVNTLPHTLAKYKEIYNKNGRIGIYTPAERAAIIAKFNSKRTRRVWNKKIRYNCRKNLADRRMRVKGRFVKRSSEEAAVAAAAAATATAKTAAAAPEMFVPSNDANVVSASSSTASLPTVDEGDTLKDVDMGVIDVNDKEAGFEPTEDQPYRRTRRHTIT